MKTGGVGDKIWKNGPRMVCHNAAFGMSWFIYLGQGEQESGGFPGRCPRTFLVDLGVGLSHGEKQMGVRVGSPDLEGAVFKADSFSSCERASQVALMLKNPPANAGNVRDAGSIPRSGRPSGGGRNNPLQYSCLDNPWTEEPGELQPIGSHRAD